MSPDPGASGATAPRLPRADREVVFLMPIITANDLLKAGAHFGHRVSRWNPKMEPYIYGKRNKIHIINLRETIRGLVEAAAFLRKVVREGRQVLIVGTKRQAATVVEREATRAGMPYVSQRWLGGTLTNLGTIRSRIKYLEELESAEKTGLTEDYSRKDLSHHRREKRKVLRNLAGIRSMVGMPGALLVVDPRREAIAGRFSLGLTGLTFLVELVTIGACLWLAAWVLRFEDVLVGSYSGSLAKLVRERLAGRARGGKR
jgi:small subunit ribosomal protein S2